MARCIAKISGDGCLSGRYVRYSNTCEELIKEFRADIQEEFGDVHFTEGRETSGGRFVQLYRKDVREKFLAHLSSYKSAVVYIPDTVKGGSLVVQKAYIRSLYDDEGCVALRIFKKTKEWKRNITLTSNSLRLLQDVKDLLESAFGITTNKIVRNRPASNYDVSFVLSLTGKSNIMLFHQQIGFNHPKKGLLLDLMVKTYTATAKHKIAFSETKAKMMEIKKRTANPGSHV